MKSDPGVSSLLLRPLASSAARLGADPNRFLQALGLDVATSADTHVPGSRVASALGELASALADDAIGLSLASASPMGTTGLFDYCFCASANLLEATERLSRYFSLITHRSSLKVERDGKVAHISIRPHAEVTHSSALSEFAVAILVMRARSALGELPLECVRFKHHAPKPHTHEEFFHAEVLFGQDVDEIVLDDALLDAPFRTADTKTLAVLEAHADRLQAELAPADPFLDRVRAAIAKGLPTNDYELAAIARQLGTSTRTMQRELRDRGTSFRDIVDDVRRELAMQLLARPRVSNIEVAFDLGFQTTPAFYRAFVRWTGKTPGAFRASKLGSAD